MKSDAVIEVFLQPGEYFVGDAGYRIRTLLGSCVSITLWHPASHMGAMTHFLLPTRSAVRRGDPPDGRYGDEALDLILAELKSLGVVPTECQAKIFGGGDMFPQYAQSGGIHVGRRNGEAARELLRVHGVHVLSESLFGIGHRQIIFTLSNGDVWQRQDGPPTYLDSSNEDEP